MVDGCPIALTILVDADNTLWDTDSIYADAQLALLSEVEKLIGQGVTEGDRLEYIREFDQEIANTHHLHLRYPPVLLVYALGFGLKGIEPVVAAKRVVYGQRPSIPLLKDNVEGILRIYADRLDVTPALRTGVKEGFEHFKEKNCEVFIVTEGSKEKCSKFIEYHNLDSTVRQIIAGAKNEDLYRRLTKLGVGPSEAVMIGDQLDRDIVPAKSAGLTTIYFPSKFQPKWQNPDNREFIDFQISSFKEVMPIIDNLTKRIFGG
ncbi:MAG: HAD family hydrolase [Rhodospirillales bacterium]|nr:HAD family hydrolase [Rhodospirillales bacterium]